MVVGTRWWRRVESEDGTDVWGGPDDVTVAPDPRESIEDRDDGRAAREEAERETAEREARQAAEREAREAAEREAREAAEREAREAAEREAREAAEREAREQAERERAEREAREQAERDRRERERIEREESEAQDLVSTLPGAETVPPPLAREMAAREAAALEATRANLRRRRRRVLGVFLVAALAVAAVWIVPRLIALVLTLVSALGIAPADTPPTPTVAEGPVAVVAAPVGPGTERPDVVLHR